MGIISTFFEAVTQPLQASITSTASAVIGAIAPTAQILLTVYICFWGWALIRGSVQEPLMDAVVRFMKLVTVYVLAVNMTYYMDFLGNWLWNSGDVMAGIITNGAGGGRVSDTNSAINFIDSLWGGFFVYGNQYWDYALKTSTAGIPNIGFLIGAFIIWIAGAVLCFFAAFLFILAKMAIAILLGIGPIFVLCIMFDSTRKFFEGWLAQVLNFVLVIILTASILAVVGTEIAANISKSYKAAAGINGGVGPNIPDLITMTGLAILVFLFLLQVQSIASGLAGGVALGVARIPYIAAAKNAFRTMQGGARAMSKSSRIARETQRRHTHQNHERNQAWRARMAEQKANKGNSTERGSTSKSTKPSQAKADPDPASSKTQGSSIDSGSASGGSSSGASSSSGSSGGNITKTERAVDRQLPSERAGTGQQGQSRSNASLDRPKAAAPTTRTNDARAEQIKNDRRNKE